ncbi:MAG: hypothetical protein JSS76_11005 [Bacteroidetes bacterium]|nr:hypothetical protein [Bacteroidota bacterium]
MKKKEYARDKKRVATKAENKSKKARQDSFDASIEDKDRNPNAKADMEKVLQALVPPVKYVKKADRNK